MLIDVDGQRNDGDQKGQERHENKRLHKTVLAGAFGKIAECRRDTRLEHQPEDANSKDHAEQVEFGADLVEGLSFGHFVWRQAVFGDFEFVRLGSRWSLLTIRLRSGLGKR